MSSAMDIQGASKKKKKVIEINSNNNTSPPPSKKKAKVTPKSSAKSSAFKKPTSKSSAKSSASKKPTPKSSAKSSSKKSTTASLDDSDSNDNSVQDELPPIHEYKDPGKGATGFRVSYNESTHTIEINTIQPSSKNKIIDTHSFSYVTWPFALKANDDDEKFTENQKQIRYLDIKKDASVSKAPSVVGLLDKLVESFKLSYDLHDIETSLIKKFTEEEKIVNKTLVRANIGDQNNAKLDSRHVFQEAGASPESFIESPTFVHNLATQVIDPASRTNPSVSTFKHAIFPMIGEHFIFDQSFLNLFGFPNCEVKSQRIDKTHHAFQITINKGAPNEVVIASDAERNLHAPYGPYFFGGNPKKNTYIDDNHTNSYRQKYCSALLVAKEMGDVFQVLSALVYDTLYKENQSIIATNDKVVFILSLLINTKCILTSGADDKYHLSIFDKLSNEQIIERFIKECKSLLLDNCNVLNNIIVKENDHPITITKEIKEKIIPLDDEDMPQSIPPYLTIYVGASSVVTPSKVIHSSIIKQIYDDSVKITNEMIREMMKIAKEEIEEKLLTPTGDIKPEYNNAVNISITKFIEKMRKEYKLKKIVTKVGRKAHGTHYSLVGLAEKKYTDGVKSRPTLINGISGGFGFAIKNSYSVMYRKGANSKAKGDELPKTYISMSPITDNGPPIIEDIENKVPDDVRSDLTDMNDLLEKFGYLHHVASAPSAVASLSLQAEVAVKQAEVAAKQAEDAAKEVKVIAKEIETLTTKKKKKEKQSGMDEDNDEYYVLGGPAESKAKKKSINSMKEEESESSDEDSDEDSDDEPMEKYVKKKDDKKSKKSGGGSSTSKKEKRFIDYFFDFYPVWYEYWSDEPDAIGKLIDAHKGYKTTEKRVLRREDIHAILKEQIYKYLEEYDKKIVTIYEYDMLSSIYDHFEINKTTLFNEPLKELIRSIMKDKIEPVHDAMIKGEIASLKKGKSVDTDILTALMKGLSLKKSSTAKSSVAKSYRRPRRSYVSVKKPAVSQRFSITRKRRSLTKRASPMKSHKRSLSKTRRRSHAKSTPRRSTRRLSARRLSTRVSG